MPSAFREPTPGFAVRYEWKSVVRRSDALRYFEVYDVSANVVKMYYELITKRRVLDGMGEIAVTVIVAVPAPD